MDLHHFLEDVECWRTVRVGYFELAHHAHSSQHTPNDHSRVGLRRLTFDRTSKITAQG